jgi:uncharacterized protein YbcI
MTSGPSMVDIGQSGEGQPSGAIVGDGARGKVASAISNRVVQLFAEYTGRGPTKARTVLSSALIAVILEDTLTKAERKLIEKGQRRLVLETRRALQETMRNDLIEAVESISGRRVVAFLSDHQLEPDFAVESFVLDTQGQTKENQTDGS